MFNFKNKSLMIIGLFVFVLTAIGGVNINAAEFITQDDDDKDIVILDELKDNIYFIGNDVEISTEAKKDLSIISQNITIKDNIIWGDINAIGRGVNIKTNNLKGSARLLGKTIVLEGMFSDDVIVCGESLTLKNTTIDGDLIFYGNKLSIDQNVVVNGDFIGSYEEYESDDTLENIVSGEITEKTSGFDIGSFNGNFSTILKASKLILWTTGSMILFIILLFVLNKRGKLKNLDIQLDKKLLYNFLTGISVIFGSMVAIIVSAFTLIFFAHTIVLVTVIYSILAFVTIYTPIYVANLISNTAKLKVNIVLLVILTYVALILISYIPWIGGRIVTVLNVCAFGYALQYIVTSLLKPLTKKEPKKKDKK